MKATVSVSKVRVEDVEVGDVIRFDVHRGAGQKPRLSNWLRVTCIAPISTDSLKLVFTFDNHTTRGVNESMRKLDIVEVQHRTANTPLPIEGDQ